MKEKRLGYTVACALVLGALFSSVFYGADRIAARCARHVVPHMAWELRLPFLPGLTLVYLSTHILQSAAPAFLWTRREIRTLAISLGVDILIAGACFILYPAELAFGPTPDPGAWRVVFGLADHVNGDYNLVPSLHVALSVSCAATYARRWPGWPALGFWLWAAAIAASTLFLRHHHAVDVITGWALGLAGLGIALRFEPPTNQSHV